MSTGKEQVEEVDEDSVQLNDQEDTKIVEVAKPNLAKRRDVDDLLESKRLQRELEGVLKHLKF